MKFFNNVNSIRVRFISTLVSNFLRIGILFCIGMIIARGLGPGDYGNFYFLLGSFTALAGLVDLGSSSAFFTFISQKIRGKIFYYYYIIWILIQFFILVGLIYLVPATLREKIWLGHSSELILFSLFATFSMNTVWRFVTQIGESIRDTVRVQIRNIIFALTYLVCIVILASYHLISIKILFIINVFLYMNFTFLYGLRLYKRGGICSQNNEKFGNVIIEFRDYCLPLMVSTFFGFFYSFADYWFLQKFGGSIQQGYYAVGSRFATLSLIATTSIIAILWKEVAEANALGNMERVRLLYTRIVKSLYFMAAFFSCLLIPFSKEIISMLLGTSYEHAWLPLSIMFLYPVHQTVGQITLTMLLATGHTKTLSIINILFMAVSIPTAYFLLAPQSSLIPGLNLGSAGLAIKMVVLQFVQVNFLSFFTSKYINSSFNWSNQFIVLFLLMPLGIIFKSFSQWVLSVFFSPHIILVMIFSGILYLIAVTVLVFFLPSIAGINRTDINKIIDWIKPKHNPA